MFENSCFLTLISSRLLTVYQRKSTARVGASVNGDTRGGGIIPSVPGCAQGQGGALDGERNRSHVLKGMFQVPNVY